MRKGMSLLLAASLAASLLAGCGGAKTQSSGDASGAASSAPVAQGDTTASGESQTGAPSGEAKTGGTLKIGVNMECVHTMLSFDLTGAGVDYYYSWPVYESLFKPNAEGTVDPWLLEDYSYDPEAVSYTHLRAHET